MRILAVGGGSGGHVTPVVAVLRELKRTHPRAELRFWCDNRFSSQAKGIMSHFDSSIRVDVIASGKLRRYHHVPMWRQLLWPSVVLPNIRDGFYVVAGIIQSLFKLIIWRPDVVFTKGGFVCLPVGLAAHILGVPLVIHDSDAHPGLTNRVLAKWATFIGTGAPLEYYDYPKTKSTYVGIPIAPEFHPFSKEEKRQARKEWHLNEAHPLIVVTGGGLGATRINNAVKQALRTLLELGSVVLVSGAAQYEELRAEMPHNDDRFQLHAFIANGMASLLGAADVVVTRAGATTILELAALATPTILIPNARLTGGHQVKNAAVYAEANAVEILDEEAMVADASALVASVGGVLQNKTKAQAMGERFHVFARPNAAGDMANLILKAAKK